MQTGEWVTDLFLLPPHSSRCVCSACVQRGSADLHLVVNTAIWTPAVPQQMVPEITQGRPHACKTRLAQGSGSCLLWWQLDTKPCTNPLVSAAHPNPTPCCPYLLACSTGAVAPMASSPLWDQAESKRQKASLFSSTSGSSELFWALLKLNIDKK